MFSFAAFAFIALSFVSLGRANDAYKTYSDGELVTVKSNSSLQMQMSLSSLKSSQKSFFFEKVEEGEEEEEEDEEEMPSENVRPVLFLWRFTAAAVCVSVFIVFFVVELFVIGRIQRVDNPYLIFLGLSAILLVVPLAIRMDGFVHVSYWIFFIPHLLLAVLVPVLFFWYSCCVNEIEEDGDVERVVFACISYAFSLAGLILFIVRLDNALPSSFRYTFIFLFFGLGLSSAMVSCFSGQKVYVAVHSGSTCDDPVCLTITDIVLFAVLYAGFFLPFTLRKELVFHTSYHFTLIPYYILIIVCSIVFTCIIYTIYDYKSFSMVFGILITSYAACVFLVLALVCLGGANDAYEKHPDGKIVTSMSISSLQTQLTLSSLISSQTSFSDESDSEGKDRGDLASGREREDPAHEAKGRMWHGK